MLCTHVVVSGQEMHVSCSCRNRYGIRQETPEWQPFELDECQVEREADGGADHLSRSAFLKIEIRMQGASHHRLATKKDTQHKSALPTTQYHGTRPLQLSLNPPRVPYRRFCAPHNQEADV